MILEVRVPVSGSDLRVYGEPLPVTDPSLPNFVGIARATLDGDFVLLTIDLEEGAIASRLAEIRRPF